ncbi:MAG: hypothetical protein CVU88_08365 [Firmicutes bacterium HGW-Firmicutes-13]|nr:MAG: hypothetical protein CVU88_08365 [Firmicutes bacterium HGW-Firmicutes-13]
MERKKITEVAPKAGFLAPNFTLNDLEGNKRSLDDYCGFLLVIFWSTGCPDCAEDMALLEEMHTSDGEINVLSINVQEDKEMVRKYVEDNGYSFPTFNKKTLF